MGPWTNQGPTQRRLLPAGRVGPGTQNWIDYSAAPKTAVAPRAAPVTGSRLRARCAVAVLVAVPGELPGASRAAETSTLSEAASGRMRTASPEPDSNGPVARRATTLFRWTDTMTLGAPPNSSSTRVVSTVAVPLKAAPPAVPETGTTIELVAAWASPPGKSARPAASAASVRNERWDDFTRFPPLGITGPGVEPNGATPDRDALS